METIDVEVSPESLDRGTTGNVACPIGPALTSHGFQTVNVTGLGFWTALLNGKAVGGLLPDATTLFIREWDRKRGCGSWTPFSFRTVVQPLTGCGAELVRGSNPGAV